MVGAFWTAIAVLSVLGLRWPQAMLPLLLLQLVYKGLWLIVVAVPMWAGLTQGPLPKAMTFFFVAWVLVLPWVIPWRRLFP